jgi:hypothetical protein
MVEEWADEDDSHARSENFEAGSRARVYGCCLPISLGLLLVVAAPPRCWSSLDRCAIGRIARMSYI